MNNKQRLLLLIAFGTVLLWGLCGCTGDAPTPHDEPPAPAELRPFKRYELPSGYVTSYALETADGQRVTCFVLSAGSVGSSRGISCIPHK